VHYNFIFIQNILGAVLIALNMINIFRNNFITIHPKKCVLKHSNSFFMKFENKFLNPNTWKQVCVLERKTILEKIHLSFKMD
jgi:hypothetical protein